MPRLYLKWVILIFSEFLKICETFNVVTNFVIDISESFLIPFLRPNSST